MGRIRRQVGQACRSYESPKRTARCAVIGARPRATAQLERPVGPSAARQHAQASKLQPIANCRRGSDTDDGRVRSRVRGLDERDDVGTWSRCVKCRGYRSAAQRTPSTAAECSEGALAGKGEEQLVGVWRELLLPCQPSRTSRRRRRRATTSAAMRQVPERQSPRGLHSATATAPQGTSVAQRRQTRKAASCRHASATDVHSTAALAAERLARPTRRRTHLVADPLLDQAVA